MTKKVQTDLNFNGNELQNAVVQNLASAPSSPKSGQIYFNTTDNKYYIYNGTTWVDLTSQGKTYSQGTGIKIDGTTIAVDTTVIAQQSDIPTDYVPNTRTVNSKALSSNITLSASDVGAVPTTRTVNSKALSSNITLSASDVNAVPTTRTVNSKALSADITLSAGDVGAYTKNETDTAISTALSSAVVYKGTKDNYSDLPTTGNKTGDMWNIKNADETHGVHAGDNVIWNGTDWDVQSGTIDLSGKQDVISDLETIRSNAANGQSAYTTIGGYGDIVTHNASEFQTKITNLSTIESNASAGKSASDTIATYGDIVTYNASDFATKVSATNTALTVSGGLCTWTISHSLGADVVCIVKEVSTGEEVEVSKKYTDTSVIITINSSANIAAGTYKAIIMG